MDKIIENLKTFLQRLEIEYRDSLLKTPEWKLNSYLPKGILNVGIELKTKYLIEKFLNNCATYKMITDDLNFLKGQSSIDSS